MLQDAALVLVSFRRQWLLEVIDVRRRNRYVYRKRSLALSCLSRKLISETARNQGASQNGASQNGHDSADTPCRPTPRGQGPWLFSTAPSGCDEP
jgi:hypothetical protein